MQFSMIFEAQLANPTREREQQLIHDCIDQAVAAEAAGFDRVWAVEHHALKRYAHMSAPEIFLTAVASRTSRIRIGHGAVCMPFNYNFPTRVAERAAMLDIVSKGRLDLGAARGGTVQEMSLCNVDVDRAPAEVEEALRIIGRVWLEDDFEWHGKLLTIKAPDGSPRHNVVPRPVQRPHPPLFLACTNPATVSRAAEYGVGALVFGFAGPESVRDQRVLYDKTRASRTGKSFVASVVNDHFSALCPSIVMEDRKEAIKIGARGQRFFTESIKYWSLPGMPPPSDDMDNDDNVAIMESMKNEMQARFDRGELPQYKDRPIYATASYNLKHAYGNPNDAIAYVEQLEAAGSDEVMCMIQMGTVPQAVCLETIRLWGKHVIPHFRNRGKAKPAAN
jgi:alkanesulfonate monooxygenase SsuD/methylene tetrahydromethanopterin reductase-like flavin-dependent oxidoreductase (luciferase family)